MFQRFNSLTLCLTWCCLVHAHAQKGENLFVFVGQKISVTSFDPGENIMDSGFKAKYKVIERVFGNYDGDTIEFEAYDHYGTPPFSRYDFVLMYVSTGKDGKLYHEKYMYSDVYQTMDGRWAGSFEAQDYDHEYNRKTKVKPVPISFKEPVSYDISKLDTKVIEEYFPSAYYKIVGTKAYVVMGNYVPELFELKRSGFLKARGLF